VKLTLSLSAYALKLKNNFIADGLNFQDPSLYSSLFVSIPRLIASFVISILDKPGFFETQSFHSLNAFNESKSGVILPPTTLYGSHTSVN
jgi:hypothetical protein